MLLGNDVVELKRDAHESDRHAAILAASFGTCAHPVLKCRIHFVSCPTRLS